ncbi:MAG: signal peptidase II [Bryobacteraceae bacterium]|nr:signal peptidase II [Bryobacteraceae bacterium]
MNRWIPFAAAGAIVVLDRITKIAVERSISMWETIPIIPNVVNLVYTRNRGAAFGLLANAPEWVRAVVLIGFSVAILIFIVRMLWRGESESASGASKNDRWPLALVLGGAVGNLYDRIVAGSVTDFVQVFIGSYEWPSFNVADSAISVGAVWLALGLFGKKERVPQDR